MISKAKSQGKNKNFKKIPQSTKGTLGSKNKSMRINSCAKGRKLANAIVARFQGPLFSVQGVHTASNSAVSAQKCGVKDKDSAINA